jgi:hypothetical protein
VSGSSCFMMMCWLFEVTWDGRELVE